MQITDTLYVADRPAWRAWLEENHDQAAEVWLVSYRKHTGRPSLSYNDAVEEALCFGWIDSTRKSLDEDRYAQRFTPRRRGSDYSQTNKERLARLIQNGRVHSSVLEELGDVDPASYQIPDDIIAALRASEEAWSFFRSTSPSYQRIRAAYVDSARRRPGEFEKRLENLVEKSAKRQQFGYDIQDYF